MQIKSQIIILTKKIPVNEGIFILFLPFLTIQEYNAFNIKITTFYILLTFLFLIIITIHNKKNIIFPKIFLWIIILLWNIFIMLKSPNLSDAINYYISTILIPFLLFIIVVNIEPTKHFLDKLFYIFNIVGIIISIYSVYIFISSGFDLKLRIASFWENQNMIAAYLMILFLFDLSFIINKKDNNTFFFHIISLLLILFAIILTQTRAVWIGIILSISIFIFKRPKVIIPFLISIALMAIIFINVFQDRFLSVINFTSDVSSLGRLQGWISSIVLIKENFLLGYGFDSYIYLRDNVFSFYIVEVIHSHNTYLRSILETGFIGFCLFFSIILSAIYYSFSITKNKLFLSEYKKYIDGFQLSFIGLLFIFNFEPYFSLFDNSSLVLWLFISTMCSIYYYSKIDKYNI